MIRAATLDDFAEVLALYRHLVPEDDSQADGRDLQQCWRELVSRPGVWVYVARQDALLVSSCTLIVVPNLLRGGRPYAVIENVVTHRDHRRQGFGRAVVEHAIRRALELDCYKVNLVASPTNAAAKALYESLGFDGSRTGFQIRNL